MIEHIMKLNWVSQISLPINKSMTHHGQRRQLEGKNSKSNYVRIDSTYDWRNWVIILLIWCDFCRRGNNSFSHVTVSSRSSFEHSKSFVCEELWCRRAHRIYQLSSFNEIFQPLDERNDSNEKYFLHKLLVSKPSRAFRIPTSHARTHSSTVISKSPEQFRDLTNGLCLPYQ